MPVYEFQDGAGRLHERVYPIGKAPRSIRVEGKRAERVYTAPTVKIDKRSEGIVSHSLPRKWPYAKDWDKEGRPRFSGSRAVDEAVARSRDTRNDHVEYS